MLKLLLLLTCTCAVNAVDWDVETELDKYVHFDDGYYNFTVLKNFRFEEYGVTMYAVNMTSQKWMNETYCTRYVWWHAMSIAIPDTINYLDAAILYIGGHDNVDVSPPELAVENIVAAMMANDTKTIVGYIINVPNQPITFHNDPSNQLRGEDDIIAWTWRTYLDNPDAPISVVARMPMTKAAKRGLDTIHDVCKFLIPNSDIQRFGVGGPSKRGWTTWSLAATDKRVVAIFPMVFSLINVEKTFMNHYMNLDGAWSFALQPYYKENLTQEIYNPRTRDIIAVEDVYMYKERFTIPKLSILSSGDEFFLSDESIHWWDDMPDPKFMMMLPNAEHIMFPHWGKIYETATSFWLSVMEGGTLPHVEWQFFEGVDDGVIRFTTNPPPVNLTVWRAETLNNDTRRDFRLAAVGETGAYIEFHPVQWKEDITFIETGPGEYMATVTKVENEWVGFFFEGTWLGPTGKRMIFTSQINVIPMDVHPHEPCLDNDACYSKLV